MGSSGSLLFHQISSGRTENHEIPNRTLEKLALLATGGY